jgi:hypothetical protein
MSAVGCWHLPSDLLPGLSTGKSGCCEDPAFKTRLLRDANAVGAELGIAVGEEIVSHVLHVMAVRHQKEPAQTGGHISWPLSNYLQTLMCFCLKT